MSAPAFHVSKHHLEGALADVPLEKILASCHRNLLTGLIRITAGAKTGTIELRAGAVDRASFDGATGNMALAKMHALYDGMYEIVQRLPDMAGELGGSATAEGEVSGVPLIKLMQHCESNALTCVITVVAGFDRAQIKYRIGELAGVEKNGVADDDAIVEILKWTDARYRIEAPPLELDVEGWPQAKADPTRPFALHKEAKEAAAPARPISSPPVDPPASSSAESTSTSPSTSTGWRLVSVVVVLLAAGAAAAGVWLAWRDPEPAAQPSPSAVPLPLDAAPAPPVDAAPAPPVDAAPAHPPESSLIGTYGYIDADDAALPAGVVKGSACQSLGLSADHKLVHECAAGWKSEGEWAYQDGILYYRIERQTPACPDTCDAVPTNHWGGLAVRVLGSYVCFDETTPPTPWPGGRDLGARVEAPEGGLPAICFEKY